MSNSLVLPETSPTLQVSSLIISQDCSYFNISGNQGHGWSKAYVFIGQQDSYTIDIKATVGKSPNSRIAFDDIAMLHCHDTAPAACTNFEFKCKTSTMCIPEEKQCNGIQDCSDGSDESGCGKLSLSF